MNQRKNQKGYANFAPFSLALISAAFSVFNRKNIMNFDQYISVWNLEFEIWNDLVIELRTSRWIFWGLRVPSISKLYFFGICLTFDLLFHSQNVNKLFQISNSRCRCTDHLLTSSGTNQDI